MELKSTNNFYTRYKEKLRLKKFSLSKNNENSNKNNEKNLTNIEKEKRKEMGINTLKKVAVLTNGGDAPGLNSVIYSILKSATKENVEVYGFIGGFKGLLENNYIKLDLYTNGQDLLETGGTIIGSSNATNVFNMPRVLEDGNVIYEDLSHICIENLKKNGFDCVFILGGDGSLKSARDFSTLGVNFIGIPKTIDNDVAHTEQCFGFATAVQCATDAMDRLKTTAKSHERILVLEVMGRYAGHIALKTAIAGGADACLLPEFEYNLEEIAQKIKDNFNKGKKYSLVVVSEGAKEKGKDLVIKKMENNGSGLDNIKLGGAGEVVANKLEMLTNITTRSTQLGYIQRGGSPIAEDRVLSSMYGAKAFSLAKQGIFNVLVTLKRGELTYVSFEDVVGDNKKIGAASGNTAETNIRRVTKDDILYKTAKDMGILFGE